jgi:hypothetical protein
MGGIMAKASSATGEWLPNKDVVWMKADIIRQSAWRIR